MTHIINYSFTNRDEPERLYSVNVPLALLAGMELNLDTVRNVVEEDLSLIAQLMGDDLKAYESMSMAPHLYQKELQRHDESIRLLSTEDEKPELSVERVEFALQTIISDVDYSLHQNLNCNEWSGQSRYPDLAKEFITLYNKPNP